MYYKQQQHQQQHSNEAREHTERHRGDTDGHIH